MEEPNVPRQSNLEVCNPNSNYTADQRASWFEQKQMEDVSLEVTGKGVKVCILTESKYCNCVSWFELAFFPSILSLNSLLSTLFTHVTFLFTWFMAAHHNFVDLSMSSKHTHHSIPTCKKCHKPVRGHIGPRGSLCRQPSPHFVTDVPASSHLAQELPEELANVHLELEVSIKDHEAQTANFSAELRSMKLNSTPISTTKSMPILGSQQLTLLGLHMRRVLQPTWFHSVTFPRWRTHAFQPPFQLVTFPPLPSLRKPRFQMVPVLLSLTFNKT